MQPYDRVTVQDGALCHPHGVEQRTRQGIKAERKAAAAHEPQPVQPPGDVVYFDFVRWVEQVGAAGAP